MKENPNIQVYSFSFPDSIPILIPRSLDPVFKARKFVCLSGNTPIEAFWLNQMIKLLSNVWFEGIWPPYLLNKIFFQAFHHDHSANLVKEDLDLFIGFLTRHTDFGECDDK